MIRQVYLIEAAPPGAPDESVVLFRGQLLRVECRVPCRLETMMIEGGIETRIRVHKNAKFESVKAEPMDVGLVYA